jgi:hypothetical protein
LILRTKSLKAYQNIEQAASYVTGKIKTDKEEISTYTSVSIIPYFSTFPLYQLLADFGG